MKALLINGSPIYGGNTITALRAIADGLNEYETEFVNVADFNLHGCTACDACRANGGKCVIPDAGNELLNKVVAADLVIFGSPVYWWGVSSQLKALIDRMYAKEEALMKSGKKIGIVAVGAATTDDPEYKIISEQFKCICDFLSLNLVLDESISAASHDDLSKNEAALAKLKSVAGNL